MQTADKAISITWLRGHG